MAIITNTYLTYGTVGIREDLSDMISMISPEDRPFSAILGKPKKTTDRRFDWQTDALATAANNAQLEGDDVTAFTAVTPTTRWDNYCQISRKEFVLSDTQEQTTKAGRKSEINYQTVKKTKEMLRDVEFALVRNTTYNAGAAATARQTRGVAGWVTQGSVGAGVGAFPVPSTNTAPVAGTARAFTEALVKSAMLAAWNSGGKPKVLLVRGSDKQLASAFGGNATRYEDSDSNKLRAAYDVYVTDFGALRVVPSIFLDAAAYLIDPEHVSMRQLRPLERKPLAKTGDAEKMLLTWEYGLEMTNKDAHAQIRDLT